MASILEMDRVHLNNIALILIAASLAYVIPFELLLISYALLGPLHYLTEISWLHDRKYFTRGSVDVGIFAGAIFVAVVAGLAGLPLDLIWFVLGVALVILVTKKLWFRAVLLSTLFTGILVFHANPILVLGAVLIPTIIHVYLFTMLFMLWGALKEGRILGFVSVGILVLAGISFFVVPMGTREVLVPLFGIENLSYFDELRRVLGLLFGSGVPSAGVALAAFISFAYTYHYLNWFSKTRVIGWNKITNTRRTVIAILYVASIGLYIYDYSMGFTALILLSVFHVLLEFPLNWKSLVGVYSELKARLV
jgi:hypothetical protein